ncbi:hypothetical protein GF314_05145 [bacterium]|nr:hypothetical protein [bacterium]
MWPSRRIPAVLVATLIATGASAQDAHHWNKQYGNRAYLLGGAVIGSVEDAAAVYYNPALLALTDRASLEVSGSAYHVSEIEIEDALGAGQDLATSIVGVAPSLVAGEISIDRDREHRLAYSLLFRHDFNVVMELRGPVSIPGLLGEADARLSLEENVNEIWSGLSYARRLHEGFGVGASVFTTYRTHRSRRGTLVASETIGEYGVVVQRDDFDYTHVGLLAKLGAGGRAGRWRYGVSLTTPTLRIAGSGSKAYDRTLAIAEPNTGLLLEYLVAETRTGLEPDYRTQLAVGAGLAYRLGAAELHLSAEWFDALREYRLLDVEPILDEQTTGPIDIDLYAASRSVINWGVGLEYRLGGRTSGYLSYHTDRSTVTGRDPLGPLAVWDIHHLAAGVSLDFGNQRLALGAVYATGSEPVEGSVDLVPGTLDEAAATSLPDDLVARYRSVMLLVGVNVDY